MFSLTMLDVGQGESFVIDSPDGTFALIDGGPIRRGLVYREVAGRIKNGLSFRWAMATQWDADHVRGLIDVVNDFPPTDFIVSGLDLPLLTTLLARVKPSVAESGTVSELEKTLRKRMVSVIPMWARVEVPTLGGHLRGWSLAPSRCVRDELASAIASSRVGLGKLRELSNRASLACWFHVYNRSWFLPGELEADQFAEAHVQFERRINATDDEISQADIVKLSHHGALGSNPVELFQYFARRGSAALVSAGGRYGHPSPVVLERLRTISDGTPFCTRLGQGCAEIQRHGRNPNLAAWEAGLNWNSVPNPVNVCHSSVRVDVERDGKCTLTPSAIQLNCPFDASMDSIHVLRKRA